MRFFHFLAIGVFCTIAMSFTQENQITKWVSKKYNIATDNVTLCNDIEVITDSMEYHQAQKYLANKCIVTHRFIWDKKQELNRAENALASFMRNYDNIKTDNKEEVIKSYTTNIVRLDSIISVKTKELKQLDNKFNELSNLRYTNNIVGYKYGVMLNNSKKIYIVVSPKQKIIGEYHSGKTIFTKRYKNIIEK